MTDGDLIARGGGPGGNEDGKDTPFAPTVDWWAMRDAERVKTLEELRVFVARLVVVYRLDVPPCWERHEGAVRLLDALHRSYLIAVHPTQVGEALIGWHQNYAFIREELHAYFAGQACSPTTHVRPRPPAWAADINEGGRSSETWRAGQEEAVAAYRQREAVRAAGA
ncbi:hypothetical protein [Actinomyces israelii]|uniref:hypothetical protein n=1 Tax=Actinomyces israelii TaxID=1659 RepID=UPI00069369F6|nr:hypothetical protein [Actinomyces israelii]